MGRAAHVPERHQRRDRRKNRFLMPQHPLRKKIRPHRSDRDLNRLKKSRPNAVSPGADIV